MKKVIIALVPFVVIIISVAISLRDTNIYCQYSDIKEVTVMTDSYGRPDGCYIKVVIDNETKLLDISEKTATMLKDGFWADSEGIILHEAHGVYHIRKNMTKFEHTKLN